MIKMTASKFFYNLVLPQLKISKRHLILSGCANSLTNRLNIRNADLFSDRGNNRQAFRSYHCFLQKKAPDFTAQTVLHDNSIVDVTLSSYQKKKYVCLLFYPLDFTYVCPTELLTFNKNYEKFQKLNVELLGISVDSPNTHIAYKKTPLAEGGLGNIQFPLVSDLTKKISRDYGVLLNDSISARGVFVLDLEGILRFFQVNDLPIGRNVDEVLRVISGLQQYEKTGELCPANWKPGDRLIKNSIESVAQYNSENF